MKCFLLLVYILCVLFCLPRSVNSLTWSLGATNLTFVKIDACCVCLFYVECVTGADRFYIVTPIDIILAEVKA